ncbi:MAG: PepSY domain-containing protein [Propionibacteriaceae bacterium]|jgi:uncharacterized membrane protein YkoI|nr:PepSY domain-containing protein [Propionibacteriaceae bacterium]
MKKRNIVRGASLIAVAALAGFGLTACDADDIIDFYRPGQTVGTDIGKAQAKQIALADAGLTEAEVSFFRVQRDNDDGRRVYDIEFYHGVSEYDYEIDMYTGQIVSKDFDFR